MNIKKLIAPALIVGMIATSLTGCGKKVTTESLLNDCKTNQEKVTSASEQINMDLSVNLSTSGVIMPISLSSSISVAQNDQKTAYVNGTFDFNMFDEAQSIPIEAYVEKDENNLISYTYSNETWSKETSEKNDDSIAELQKFIEKCDFYGYMLNKKDSITLEEDTISFNDKDCYVLNAEINTKDFSEYLINKMDEETIKDFEMTQEEIDEAKKSIEDMTPMDFPVVCYIYKDSSLPAYLELDLTNSLKKYESEINELINSISKTDDTNTEDEESSSFACTFEKFKITIAFDKYNETKVEIPSDVKENAVETGLELDF